jgi:hypothetical protein
MAVGVLPRAHLRGTAGDKCSCLRHQQEPPRQCPWPKNYSTLLELVQVRLC